MKINSFGGSIRNLAASIRNILPPLTPYEADVRTVMSSIKHGLGKEYRINPNVTVGDALGYIWNELDKALSGARDEHTFQRIRVMNTAIDRLGLREIRSEKVSKILPARYLERS